MTIKAVTFDFWRTLFRDTQSRERHRARVAALSDIAGIEHARAKEAMNHTMSEFLRIHVTEQRTLRPLDAIPIIEEHLGESIDAALHEPIADAFSKAILDHRPEPIEDALEAIAETARRVPLGLISDTGISPGSSLEVLLADCGVLGHFTALTFSDRVGVAKPRAAMFEQTARALGCGVDELLHIGDLEPTDVDGALNVGAAAGLFAGDNDRFANDTKAQYTFLTWREYLDRLPEIVAP